MDSYVTLTLILNYDLHPRKISGYNFFMSEEYYRVKTHLEQYHYLLVQLFIDKIFTA